MRGAAARPPEPVPREPHLPLSAGQQPLARQQALVDRRRETTVTAATIRRRSHDPAATARALPPGRWSAAPLPATGWSAAPANPTVTVAEFLRSEPPQLGVDHPGSAQRAPGARRGSASTRAGSAGTALPWSTGRQPSRAATPDGDRRRETPVTAATTRRRSRDPTADWQTLPSPAVVGWTLPPPGWSAAPATPGGDRRRGRTVRTATTRRGSPGVGPTCPGCAAWQRVHPSRFRGNRIALVDRPAALACGHPCRPRR